MSDLITTPEAIKDVCDAYLKTEKYIVFPRLHTELYNAIMSKRKYFFLKRSLEEVLKMIDHPTLDLCDFEEWYPFRDKKNDIEKIETLKLMCTSSAYPNFRYMILSDNHVKILKDYIKPNSL